MIDRGVRLLLVLLVLVLGAAWRAGAATFVDEGDGIAVTDDDPPADPDEADDPQDEDTAEGDDADGAEAEDEAAEADADADDADQADADEAESADADDAESADADDAESADADDADADTDDAGADDAHADDAAENADEADSDDADEAGADEADADDDASEADDPEAAEAGDASDSDTAEAASAANEDAGSSGAAPTTDEVPLPPPPPPPPPPDAAGPPKFGYELEVDGEVMQFQEVSGLDFEAQAIEYRDENSPTFSDKKKPGIKKHSAITLTRGTFVKANKLLDWFATKTTVARKSVTIRLLDESGTPTMVWLVINAWPTQVSGASESAVKTVVLEHEGLEVPKLQPR